MAFRKLRKSSAPKTEEVSEILPLEPKKVKRIKKRRIILWILLSFSFLVGVVFAQIAYSANRYKSIFESAAGTSIKTLYQDARKGWSSQLPLSQNRTNILILGLDEMSASRKGSMLTDTIIIASINQTGEVTLISMPRDIWIDPLKTKINSLYYYGQESETTSGIELTQKTLEEITGLKFHYYVVANLDTLEKIIDELGYVTIDVDQGFVDTQFPRSDIDPANTNLEELYETVEFKEGEEKMNGKRAMQYIRSRHSSNKLEGTDNARSLRQQHLIKALIARLKTKEILLDPAKMGHLYRLRNTEIKTNLTDSNIIALAKHFWENQPQINSAPIPITEGTASGVLYHPPIAKYNLWVYEPMDSSWSEFKKWIEQTLAI